MAQNPYGGPPPFANGAQFPAAFSQSGVQYFAPPPPPHLLVQQQFAAAGGQPQQQQFPGQHQPQQQFSYQGNQQQAFLASGSSGYVQTGHPQQVQQQPPPQQVYHQNNRNEGNYSRSGNNDNNFRKPNSFGGNTNRQNSYRGGYGGGGNSDRNTRGSYDRPNSSNNRNFAERSKFSPSLSPAGSSSDLNDFGDMGAAAKSYKANVPKYQSMRSEGGDDDLPQAPLDNNQYRQQHILTVFDSQSPESISSVPDPYQKFEDFAHCLSNS